MTNILQKRWLNLLMPFFVVALFSSCKKEGVYSGKITGYSKSVLAANIWEQVSIKVRNTGDPVDFRVEPVSLPEGFLIKPEFVRKRMKKNASDEFVFQMKAPKMTEFKKVVWALNAVYGGFLPKKELRLHTVFQNINVPQIVVEPASFDFGKVYQEKVSHDFIVKNVGYTNLKIRSISTSCGCTTATLKSRSGKPINLSKREGASGKAGYKLAPNESTILTVTYDPLHHKPQSSGRRTWGAHSASNAKRTSPQGILKRTVYIKSSDPKTPETDILITINQR